MVPLEKVLKAINRGLSHFGKCLPVLLRVLLCLLFLWYCNELRLSANNPAARYFLWLVILSFIGTFLTVIIFTYVKYPWSDDTALPLVVAPLWPFLLINLVVILLVTLMGKWEHDHGLLGFTQHWMQKVGDLLSGGGQ